MLNNVFNKLKIQISKVMSWWNRGRQNFLRLTTDQMYSKMNLVLQFVTQNLCLEESFVSKANFSQPFYAKATICQKIFHQSIKCSQKCKRPTKLFLNVFTRGKAAHN